MLPGKSRWFLSTSIPHIFVLDCAENDNQVNLFPSTPRNKIFLNLSGLRSKVTRVHGQLSLSLSLRRPCSRSFRDDVRVLLQSLNESLVTPAVLAVFFFFCRFLKFARPPGHMLSSIYITIYYLFFFFFFETLSFKKGPGDF